MNSKQLWRPPTSPARSCKSFTSCSWPFPTRRPASPPMRTGKDRKSCWGISAVRSPRMPCAPKRRPQRSPRRPTLDCACGLSIPSTARAASRKNGEFSVMIAFVDQGQAALGVVLEPALGRLTYAVRGEGCWQRDGAGVATRCQVSSQQEVKAATLTQSRSRDPGKQSRRVKLLSPGRVIETYSAGIKLAQVARGKADIYLNSYDEVHDWDICRARAGGGSRREGDGAFGRAVAVWPGRRLATEWIAGDQWVVA